METGLVPRFPTAILITGMVIIAVLCFFAGLILDTVTRGRREMRRLAYLSHSAPSSVGEGDRSTKSGRGARAGPSTIESSFDGPPSPGKLETDRGA